jgi:hypothetical protein
VNIRPIDLDMDYTKLCLWWEGHKALPVPRHFLPFGFMAEEDGHDIAACFLYLDVTGRLSMIEYLTTNPEFSLSKKTLAAFKSLIAHVESLSFRQGCRAIISMVAPGTSEERIMGKLGYATSTGVAHRMWGRKLTEAPCP